MASKSRVVIQVHGRFWLQHPGGRHAVRPRATADYWLPKLDRNIAPRRPGCHGRSRGAWLADVGVVGVQAWHIDIAALDARLREFI